MSQLREFAQRKKDFDDRKVEIVALSIDDQSHARQVWEKVIDRQFTILSDPSASVIRKYGLLHAKGRGADDIAIGATIFVDAQGIESWRRVSKTIEDIPTAYEILQRVAAP